MKRCVKCKEDKPSSEFNKHSTTVDRLYPECKPCHRAGARKWAAENRERRIATMQAWYRANRETQIAKACAWYQENKERVRVTTRARYKRDPSKIKAATKRWNDKNQERARLDGLARNRKWVKAHPAQNNAIGARKRSHKIMATPPWADLRAIKAFYERARELELETGQKWHVDHIVPLRSKIVCGLHCEANLQVLPAGDNIRKGNRWWPDMP